jgi:pyruvate,water dikinase
LRANQGALEDMADIQTMLQSPQPYGMVQVKTVCAHVSLEVWKIVDAMRSLSPGRYDVLGERMDDMRSRLNERIGPPERMLEGPLVLDMSEINISHVPLVGSKMAVLGEVAGGLGLKTPQGFAVTAVGFHCFMDANELGEEIERRIRSAEAVDLDEIHALSSSIQGLIMDSPLPDELIEAFEGAAETYTKPMAVRSSALSEDGESTSFAGLHSSFLNVAPEHLPHAYKEVVAGLYKPAAMMYRLHRGIPDHDAIMSVGVLEMVEAVSGGVLYTKDPLGRRTGMVVNSVWGLPKPVVDGRTACDTIYLSSDGKQVEEADIAFKEDGYYSLPEEGIARRPVPPEDARTASISNEEALRLGELAGTLVGRFNTALDIEWAIDPEGDIVLLQSRPLHSADPDPSAEAQADFPRPAPDKILMEGGFAASPGVAGGPVYKVEKTMDMLDFPQGAVLVVPQALPKLAALLSRASAVVAEKGSIAGHLATVCREYKVPALFGLDEAVETLANKQVVTISADTGLVIEGSPEEYGPIAPPEIVETPVRHILREAAELITPLNMLDPSSPHFRAANVATYHDVTRYCHEKSVEEMFRFGRDHHFPERSSKQLYTHTATRWWVLNLEDGFDGEAEGKFIRLENISCRPMLALWEGVVAMPWEGPPPIDSGGLLSVMFRSTTDTTLVAGGRSKQTERNYFMISKQYCCLSSRLGYHFCTTETLVTERYQENYAVFRFQGGAADDTRRVRRVRLLAGMLEDEGFEAVIRGDNLTARIQSLPEDEMFRALRILGFLSIHTRQIDMVLSGDGDIAKYDKKLRKQMHEALQDFEPQPDK